MSSCQPKRIVAIMPVHNAPEYVERSLRQLRETTPFIPLVIVNDASGPETRRLLDAQVQIAIEAHQQKRGAEWFLLRNSRQQLFTRTVNRGLRFAERNLYPDLFLVLNSDCDFHDRDWLKYLVKPFQNPRVGIVGYPDSPERTAPRNSREEAELYRVKAFPEYVTGHCLALSRAMLRKIGIFRETDLDGSTDPAGRGLHGLAHLGSDRVLSWDAWSDNWQTLECQYNGIRHAAGKSWNHDLQWLRDFQLEPLWEPNDTLELPRWYADVAGENTTW